MQIQVIEMSSNDAWMRDVGPSFLVNDHGELRACDWRFNAWGGDSADDKDVPAQRGAQPSDDAGTD